VRYDHYKGRRRQRVKPLNTETLHKPAYVCSINYITPNLLTAIADSSRSIRGADKSLAQPGRKQANVSVRMA